jgi:hypothetical protein
MKTKSAFILSLLSLLLSTASFAQNANESIPQNYTGVHSLNSMPSFYGGQLPSSLSSAMKTMRIFESSTDDLLAYPNPTLGLMRVILHEPSPDWVYVLIIDMNGIIQRAMQFSPDSHELHVDMGSLPNGLYSVRVFGNQVSYHNLKVQKN